MIKVNFTNNSIMITGHANFDNYGKDIVCASVSSIVITSANDMFIVDETALEYIDDGNKILINIIKDDELINKLFKNLKNLLINLAKDYPKNIKVESEE
ncbi:MAG: ribosomal-processing cysteine protease Prp [Bacilli bacterium]|nr:ribosomal-processing cysteine protease Prp [Bacilli bacterium]